MRQALGSLREGSAHGCGPAQAAGIGDLAYAIETLLARMRSAGYRVEFECDDRPTYLPGEYTSNVYAIVREALTNISKHADATIISICLFCFESHLFLSIADNGVGMARSPSGSPARERKSGYHQGLIGMRERVALLGGQLTLESVPTRGTRIDIDIPLPGALHGYDTYTAIIGES
jgi:signal transduction histidine kinase